MDALLKSLAAPNPYVPRTASTDLESVLERPLFDKTVSPLCTLPPTFNPNPILNTQNTPQVSQGVKTFWDTVATAIAHVGKALHSGPILSKLPSFFLPSDPEHFKSCSVRTDGYKSPEKEVLFVNGMNTPFKELMQHLEYFQRSAEGMSIDAIYNHSNGIFWDLVEIVTMNYFGFAPRTADEILKELTAFHERNKGNPNAKILVVGHSMGTIQVKAALEKAPQEIRDRVTYRGFGVAAIITDDLCHKAINYASKKDPIHQGENLHTIITACSNADPIRDALLEQLAKNKKELILVEPHPDSTDPIDHGIETPTFSKIIEKEIKEYLNK